MSLARAYVECMRCYELSQTQTNPSDSPSPKDKLYQLRVKKSQHQTRIRALEELESIDKSDHNGYRLQEDSNHYVDNNINRYLDGSSKIKKDGLSACLNCDNSRPSLAQFLRSGSATISSLLAVPETVEKPHNYRTNAKQE